MFEIKQVTKRLTAVTALLLGGFAINGHAATATYNPSTGLVELPVVEVLSGGSSAFYSAQLQLSGSELQLVSAAPIGAATGQRNVFDSDTAAVHIPSVLVGADDFYVKLKLVPGSNPLRFSLDQVVSNAFQGCPSFSANGPVAGSCILSGTITSNVTLTKNIQWILSGGVYVGGDKAQNATLTINPGTQIFGQSGADYLWIRRGSKIMAEGTPDNPIVMSGPLQQEPGEWAGLVISGNAPVNGCNAGVALCEIPFEAITTEKFGGNNPNDNSGVLKYVQILFAGAQVRPDEELNGLTLNGVGSGTIISHIHVHAGLDDGIEVFGGTAQMKYLVLTDIRDDSLDWTQGWKGRAQFVLIKQAADSGDRGIEADNNEVNHDSAPRTQPVLSNMTIIGRSGSAVQGVLLRRGTGANIHNSVIAGGFSSCVRIDGASTYNNAGSVSGLSGNLTIENSFVSCTSDFSDGEGKTFTTADWFAAQSGNQASNPLLNGYLPAAGSPLTTSGSAVSDAFFTVVDYAGAFKDAGSDWTREWTFPF